jgi:prepilin-type N-terminal cleavage/methylation domain-containing protein
MRNRINHSGFTMMEIVAVIVIMVIVAAVAVMRLPSDQSNLIATKDTLTSHLRLAQARAMNNSMTIDAPSVWGVRFISTTQYHLFYCDTASTCNPSNVANRVAFPGAGSLVMDISRSKVQVTNGAMIIAFDRFGTPYTDATLATPLTPALTLNLRDNNGNTRPINITPQTGMITS